MMQQYIEVELKHWCMLFLREINDITFVLGNHKSINLVFIH